MVDQDFMAIVYVFKRYLLHMKRGSILIGLIIAFYHIKKWLSSEIRYKKNKEL